MNISVIAPIEAAVERMRQILFSPFDLRKWFVLGFCAFLAHLAEGGGGGGGGGGDGVRDALKHQGEQGGLNPAISWVQEHLLWVVFGGAALAFLILGLMLLVTWVRSRGKFMFLDGVVKNRGAVVEPWHTFQAEGNRLFLFAFVLGLAFLAYTLVALVIGVAAAWADIRANTFGSSAITAIVLGVLLFLPMMLAYLVIHFFLEDFIIPAMYLRRVGILAAWNAVRDEVLAGHLGTVVLYFLMRILLGIAIAVIGLILTCLTCCLAALPYLGSVILLPLLVFKRAYSLHFLAQFGSAWDCFATPPAAPDLGR